MRHGAGVPALPRRSQQQSGRPGKAASSTRCHASSKRLENTWKDMKTYENTMKIPFVNHPLLWTTSCLYHVYATRDAGPRPRPSQTDLGNGTSLTASPEGH